MKADVTVSVSYLQSAISCQTQLKCFSIRLRVWWSHINIKRSQNPDSASFFKARAQIITVQREILQTGCDLLLSLAVRRRRGLASRLRPHHCCCCCCSRSSSTWTDVSAALPFCMFRCKWRSIALYAELGRLLTHYNPLLIPNQATWPTFVFCDPGA